MSITARILVGCATVGLVIPVIAAVVAIYYFYALAGLVGDPNRALASAYAAQASQVVLMLTLVAGVMSVTLGVLMGRSLVVPVRRMTGQLRDLREGRSVSPAPVPPVKDELRQLWQAVQEIAEGRTPMRGAAAGERPEGLTTGGGS